MRQVGDRTEVGEGDLGNVFIFHFESDPTGDKKPQEHRYEVRMGNHTVASRSTLKEAEAVANALVGKEEDEPKATGKKARAKSGSR